jgi:peptide deformylase
MQNLIIQDKDFLSIPCEKVSIEEGEKIGQILTKTLLETRDAIGLAANQVGIRKKVCLVHVTQPILLINPVIVASKGEINFKEACLSFPEDYINTTRHSEIKVVADIHSDVLSFSKEKNLLECVCVQHEIDHLNGVTMHDREKQ